jgi:hypothetical protein
MRFSKRPVELLSPLDSLIEIEDTLRTLIPVDFTSPCPATDDEPLCGRKECEEVGCVFDKLRRAKLAIKEGNRIK